MGGVPVKALYLFFALAAFGESPFESAVSEYYRSVAVLNADQANLVQIQMAVKEDLAGVRQATEAMKTACVGTLEGMDAFRPVCKPAEEKTK